MVRYEAAMAGATSAEIKLIESMQQEIAVSKKLAMEEQERIASAIASEKQLEKARSQALQSNISSIDRAAASQKKKQQDDQKAQQATNNLVAALRDEAAIYGMTRDQIDLYRLTQAGATE
jgi:predicted  nucleic acid-binding Zn-ribbon protein